MLRVLEFPLLESLKASDHILFAEEVLKLEMDEDTMFRDLHMARHLCSLGPSMSPPQPQNNAALDVVALVK